MRLSICLSLVPFGRIFARRCAYCALFCGLLPACGNKHDAKKTEACLVAHVDYYNRLAQGVVGGAEQLNCPGLYREEACAKAWGKELALADQLAETTTLKHAPELPQAKRIAEACATAYCDKLSSELALCGSALPEDQVNLIRSLKEFEVAVLMREGIPRETSEALARKAELFLRVEPKKPAATSRTTPPSPGGVEVEIAADKSLKLNGESLDDAEFLVRLGQLESLRQTRAVIRADKTVEHGRVMAVLDDMKKAGLSKIAFAVSAE